MIKKFFSMLLVLSLNCPVMAQNGYQQPIVPESQEDTGSLYDQVLQQRPKYVEQVLPPSVPTETVPRGYGQELLPPASDQRFVDPGIGTAARPLKGRVVVVPAGTRFEARLSTTISSGINSIGDTVTATVSSPGVIGGYVPIPAGSQLIGQVANAIPAERFKAGKGGVLELIFTTLQTPDGKTYPIRASVDQATFQLNAETGGSRLAQGVKKTAVGAGLGAALGTALGAISGGKKGVGKGAWSGAAIGSGIGALSALVSKGGELILKSGETLPIKLDQSFQAVVPQP